MPLGPYGMRVVLVNQHGHMATGGNDEVTLADLASPDFIRVSGIEAAARAALKQLRSADDDLDGALEALEATAPPKPEYQLDLALRDASGNVIAFCEIQMEARDMLSQELSLEDFLTRHVLPAISNLRRAAQLQVQPTPTGTVM